MKTRLAPGEYDKRIERFDDQKSVALISLASKVMLHILVNQIGCAVEGLERFWDETSLNSGREYARARRQR